MRLDKFACLLQLHATSLHCSFFKKNNQKSNIDKIPRSIRGVEEGIPLPLPPCVASSPSHGCLEVDNAIHRRNRHPLDTCWQNKPRYALDMMHLMNDLGQASYIFNFLAASKDYRRRIHLSGAG